MKNVIKLKQDRLNYTLYAIDSVKKTIVYYGKNNEVYTAVRDYLNNNPNNIIIYAIAIGTEYRRLIKPEYEQVYVSFEDR